MRKLFIHKKLKFWYCIVQDANNCIFCADRKRSVPMAADRLCHKLFSSVHHWNAAMSAVAYRGYLAPGVHQTWRLPWSQNPRPYLFYSPQQSRNFFILYFGACPRQSAPNSFLCFHAILAHFSHVSPILAPLLWRLGWPPLAHPSVRN